MGLSVWKGVASYPGFQRQVSFQKLLNCIFMSFYPAFFIHSNLHIRLSQFSFNRQWPKEFQKVGSGIEVFCPFLPLNAIEGFNIDTA